MSSTDFSALAATIQSEVNTEDQTSNNWTQTLLDAENTYLTNKGEYYALIQTLLKLLNSNSQLQNEIFNDILSSLQAESTATSSTSGTTTSQASTSGITDLQNSLTTYQTNQTNILEQLSTITQDEYQNDKTLHTVYVNYFTYLLSNNFSSNNT